MSTTNRCVKQFACRIAFLTGEGIDCGCGSQAFPEMNYDEDNDMNMDSNNEEEISCVQSEMEIE